MSKTRWIALFIIVCTFVLGPITLASPDRGPQAEMAAAQNASVDWCCVAGMPCCTIPPNQAQR